MTGNRFEIGRVKNKPYETHLDFFKKLIHFLQKTPSVIFPVPRKRSYIFQFHWELKICKPVHISGNIKSLRIFETCCSLFAVKNCT